MHSDGGADASEPTVVADDPRAYHAYHDSRDTHSLSETVIEAIATIRNRDPTDDPIPLANIIDPDALDSLFANTHRGSERSAGHVVFSLSGLVVFVHANDHIFIREQSADA
ncbi:HalOD1 output domain-containing protein [Haladaptatus pallidirubidus]|uniref:Halobacterial output domain-containing protein n=1 Tax=Haladaptatus pallidirubidus TaxID=1008152 RepID=A0AAV3UEQ7_9EURY|nr:HalOD1 output domain-containing protein [Haladaptatus pallidirubidus]